MPEFKDRKKGIGGTAGEDGEDEGDCMSLPNGAVKPIEVRDGTRGVKCILCGGENAQGNHILHYKNCVCPYCGDTILKPPGIMWHLPQCQRSNWNNHYMETISVESTAQDYWIIRTYLQGFPKIHIAKAMDYKSTWTVNKTLINHTMYM